MPESLIERLLREWPAAGSGHRWPAPGGLVHSGKGVLIWQAAAAATGNPVSGRANRLDLSNPGVIEAPGWGGQWVIQAAQGLGGDANLLREVQLRERQGAEQFQLHPRSQPRSLKKQYQALGVAAACRGGPLVYVQDQLIYVPGLGLDARAAGRGGQARVTIDWVPAAAG